MDCISCGSMMMKSMSLNTRTRNATAILHRRPPRIAARSADFVRSRRTFFRSGRSVAQFGRSTWGVHSKYPTDRAPRLSGPRAAPAPQWGRTARPASRPRGRGWAPRNRRSRRSRAAARAWERGVGTGWVNEGRSFGQKKPCDRANTPPTLGGGQLPPTPD